MNSENEINSILRRAPKPTPNPELAARLKREIPIHRPQNGSIIDAGQTLWRRWLPAIGYAVMILGCVVVLAVQTHHGASAGQKLEELREEVAGREQQLVQRREQSQRHQALASRIARLQANAAEADQLTATLAELRALIAKLTLETADLETKLADAPERNDVIAPYDFFNDPEGPMMKAKAEAASISCINNMKQIGLAIRIWETEHNDQFPPNLNTVTNELGTPKVLCCPSDTASRELAEQLRTLPDQGWSRWPLNGGSYDVFLSPGVNSTNPEVVITRCRFHGHEGHADGSVFSGRRESVQP